MTAQMPSEEIKKCIRDNLDELDENNSVRLHQAYKLRSRIEERLKEHGFKRQDERTWKSPEHNGKQKEILRKIHRERLKEWLSQYQDWIRDNEEDLIGYFANGDEIQPSKIKPKLVQVPKRGEYRRLYRYAKYTWSLPLKKGWGRAVSYLVMDEHNDKLIGIFALTDPVYNMHERDEWIGWDVDDRSSRLKNVMDTYVLGAVPPYNDLLGGKLVASLACSNRVRADVKDKYGGKESLISGDRQNGELALITTTSAWGKSSMLSRLQYKDRKMWKHIGFTKGYGHFHLDTGLAADIIDFLKKIDHPVTDKTDVGDGPSPKFRMIKDGLNLLEVGEEVLKHGIKRGFYAAPLARNFKKYLRGDDDWIDHYDMSVEDIFEFFRERYLLDRAERIDRWKEFDRDAIRVSKKLDELGI